MAPSGIDRRSWPPPPLPRHQIVVVPLDKWTSAGAAGKGQCMKPPIKRPADLKRPNGPAEAYARPTPKVSRQKTAKVLTDAERAAFLGSRPDLTSKS
jgi:hypothetical protein